MDKGKLKGDFDALVETRPAGIPMPNHQAYCELLDRIREDVELSTIGRRASLWLIQHTNLAQVTMAVFPHREWGRRVGFEIQATADIIGIRYRSLFLACKNGLHLSHHCGALDDLGRWNHSVRGNTLWISEGGHYYPTPDERPDMMVVKPTLAEIGAVAVMPDSGVKRSTASRVRDDLEQA